MPRETNTSLFESHVTQFLFVTVCLIGLILILLIFFQNYKGWKERRAECNSDEQLQREAEKAANNDFLISLLLTFIIMVGFIFLIVVVGGD